MNVGLATWLGTRCFPTNFCLALRGIRNFAHHDQPPALKNILTVLSAIVCVLAFYEFRNLEDILNWRTNSILPASIIALAGAVAFTRVNYKSFPTTFTILTKTTAVGILAYLIFEPPDLTLANSAYAQLATYVRLGYWVAIPTATLGIWRPSYLYPAALYVMTTFYAADEISGFSVSTLDIRYMVEMAQFLSLSACGIAQLQMWAGRLRELRVFKVLALVEPSDLAQCFAFIAIGFHFGNYFWSGVTKLELGPHLWSWAFLNHTQNLMLGAFKRGILLSGPVPWLTQTLFGNFGKMVALSNIAVLVAQLLAVLAVLRVRWLVIASLVYDVLHIGIYIFGGLFFWPWIWNNLSVIFAVRDKSDKDIGWAPKLCCIITILFGGSLTLGGSARLAWWDVADIKIPIIQAQAANRNWVDVPTSFFLTHSTAISHGYEDVAKTQGHYLPTLWNATLDFDRQKTSGTCPEPPRIVSVESQSARQKRLERLGKFLRAHHRKILRRADKNGHYNFYLRLYIHPANPLLNEKFSAIDLREIKRYRLLTQSTCMSMKNGRLVERVIKEDVVTFNVDE